MTINDLYKNIHEINERLEITYSEKTAFKQDVIEKKYGGSCLRFWCWNCNLWFYR